MKKSKAEELRERKKELKKLDKEWSEKVKEIYEGRCAICKSRVRINAHHIIPKEFIETRHDVENGIALCPRHHKWGMFSAHRNSIWFLSKIESQKVKYLTNKINQIYETTKFKK